MWASPARNNNNGGSYKDSTSPSKYFSSTRSSPAAPCSPPSTVIPSFLSAKKSMEEVWKDISLASLNDITPQGAGTFISTTTNSPPFLSSMILQDFLARPINKEPPRRSGVSNETSLGEETTFLGSLSPSPGTILSLNSGPVFKYIESGDPVGPNPAVNSRTAVATPLSFGSSYSSSSGVFGSSAVFPSCKKRAQENNENPDDRRLKLMMKNRESAARSRARKQAYTNELELEVARLVKENLKLRKHQEKLVAAPSQLPKKNSLSRTLTAPF